MKLRVLFAVLGVLAATLSLGLSGCGNKEEDTSSSTPGGTMSSGGEQKSDK